MHFHPRRERGGLLQYEKVEDEHCLVKDFCLTSKVFRTKCQLLLQNTVISVLNELSYNNEMF